MSTTETYADRLREPPHRSFFRDRLGRHAPLLDGQRDRTHEHLIDQANLRGFFGAYSARENLGSEDLSLSLEDIVVGFLQPHAPAEPRILKLVLRILQSARVDLDRLLLSAKRERALPVLAWFSQIIPTEEINEPIAALQAKLMSDPPRDRRRPDLRYSPARLLGRAARG